MEAQGATGGSGASVSVTYEGGLVDRVLYVGGGAVDLEAATDTPPSWLGVLYREMGV